MLSVKNLEVESDSELQRSHAGSAFESCNLPVVASLAVDAAVGSIIRTEGVHRVIEYVKRVHAELRHEPLVDVEPLRDRHVVIEAGWSIESVATKVADRSTSWQSERPLLWLRERADVRPDRNAARVKNRWHWGEVSNRVIHFVETSYTCMETAGDFAGATWACVGNRSAFIN